MEISIVGANVPFTNLSADEVQKAINESAAFSPEDEIEVEWFYWKIMKNSRNLINLIIFGFSFDSTCFQIN